MTQRNIAAVGRLASEDRAIALSSLTPEQRAVTVAMADGSDVNAVAVAMALSPRKVAAIARRANIRLRFFFRQTEVHWPRRERGASSATERTTPAASAVSRRIAPGTRCGLLEVIEHRDDDLVRVRNVVTNREAIVTRRALRRGLETSSAAFPEYKIWRGMIARCHGEHPHKNYGGRGVIVCRRWREPDGRGFLNFLSDMGMRPSAAHSIDRFPDGNGHYEPSNCRWATRRQQALNRPRARRLQVTDDGTTLTISEWATRTGVPQATIYGRLANGWPTHDALWHPVGVPRPARESVNAGVNRIGVTMLPPRSRSS